MIKYKLLNYLFGYDYIQWHNSADSGIARVQKDGNGVVLYFRYKSTKVVDRINNPKEVIWLTCSPDKFFSDKVDNSDESIRLDGRLKSMPPKDVMKQLYEKYGVGVHKYVEMMKGQLE